MAERIVRFIGALAAVAVAAALPIGLVAGITATGGAAGPTTMQLVLAELIGLACALWVLAKLAARAGYRPTRALLLLVPVVGLFAALDIMWRYAARPARAG